MNCGTSASSVSGYCPLARRKRSKAQTICASLALVCVRARVVQALLKFATATRARKLFGETCLSRRADTSRLASSNFPGNMS